MRINWNEPKFDDADLKEVSGVLKANYVNEGPKTKELEEKFKEYFGVKHVIFTVNATAALFLAIKADALIRKVENFEVIVPDMTMFATAVAVEWAGGKPILVDVEKDRMTINIEEIEKKVTSKTTAIIPVHILGRSADMEKINEIAQRYNLTIIEDAAGAFGSKINGEYLGTIGKVGCFSLQSNKIITSGQGGVIVTNDDQYNEVIRRLKDFGRFNKEFLHKIVGYNLKFNDLSAALVLSQFNKLEERKTLLINQRNQYEQELSFVDEIKFPEFKGGEIPLWVDILVQDRELIANHLKNSEIYSRECWPALHKNPPYQNQGNDEDYPISSFISSNVLWLPNGPAINQGQINLICNKIKEFYRANFTNEPHLEKIHKDARGGIYSIQDLLENNKEFAFLEVNQGHARGGCFHSKDENLVVIKGKIKLILGHEEKIISQGESTLIPANVPHAFIGIEDSIVAEWGITTEEKQSDIKDPDLRRKVDEVNEGIQNSEKLYHY